MDTQSSDIEITMECVYSNRQECVICNEKMLGYLATLECKHTFHKYCIAVWAGDPKNIMNDRKKTCPICRGPLELEILPEYIRRNIPCKKNNYFSFLKV
jgi:hypothetical protein